MHSFRSIVQEWYRTREFQLCYKSRFGKFPHEIADYNDKSCYESREEFDFYLRYFPDSWYEDIAKRKDQEILDSMTPEQREKRKKCQEEYDEIYKSAMREDTRTLAEVAEFYEEIPRCGKNFFRCFPELREKFYEMLEKEPNKCLKDLFSD